MLQISTFNFEIESEIAFCIKSFICFSMFSIHNISLGSEKILLPISLRSFCCITSAIYISVKARNSKGDNDSICLFSKSGIEDNASMYALLAIPSSVLPPSGQTKSIIRRKTSLHRFSNYISKIEPVCCSRNIAASKTAHNAY